jgi:small subunit ribosomal protein S3
MGQKVNPISLRIGLNRTWSSKWFATRKGYATKLHEDLAIRKFIDKKLKTAGLSRVIIERTAGTMKISLLSSKPGIIIGKKGSELDNLKKDILKMTKGLTDIAINIIEIKKPEVDAKIVADGISQQLERRVAFKKAMKRALQSATKFGALGIKISCSGRLNGAEIARTEWYREGRIPLHTLRADIDYGTSEAHTTYGAIGVKVWIYKGDLSTSDPSGHERKLTGMK